MEYCSSDTTIASPSHPPLPPPPVASPCAACKILRRRCVEKCVLAPYFPPNDPLKFTIAHRVFGASNIIKLVQEVPEAQRADAVSSMVYEASARLRDPVYGSTRAISQLQNQVNELQKQLAIAQAEIVKVQTQQSNFMALICMEKWHNKSPHQHHSSCDNDYQTNMSFLDENLGSLLDHVWT